MAARREVFSAWRLEAENPGMELPEEEAFPVPPQAGIPRNTALKVHDFFPFDSLFSIIAEKVEEKLKTI